MHCASRGLLVALSGLAVLGSARNAEGQSHKNVVLIILDDAGVERFSFWPSIFPNYSEVPVGGYPELPNLESLAASGISYTNFWVNPVCSSTRAALMTGRHAHRTGVGEVIGAGDTFQFDTAEVLLPELLKTVGSYHTGLFGKWHLSEHGATDNMIVNGFDTFRGIMSNIEEADSFAVVTTPPEEGHYYHWMKTVADVSTPPAQPVEIGSDTSGELTDWNAYHTLHDALDWIRDVAQRPDPYFACVAFSPPHTPWQVPPTELLGETALNQIASADLDPGDFVSKTDPDNELRSQAVNWMLEAVDTLIGELVSEIDQTGTLCDTLFVVLSDNGSIREALSQGSSVYNPGHGKATPYNLGTKVPLIVTCGSTLAECKSDCPDSAWGTPGLPDDRLISVVDLWRTIPIMAGVDPAAIDIQETLSGLAPFDSLDISGGPVRAFALIERFKNLVPHCVMASPLYRRAVTDGDFKLVVQNTGAGVPSVYQTMQYLDLGANEIEDPSCNLLDTSSCSLATLCTMNCNAICVSTAPCAPLPSSCLPGLMETALCAWLSCP